LKKYTCSQARQRLSEVLDAALTEDVLITRRGGETFKISRADRPLSPMDVPGIQTTVTTRDIIDAVRSSRRRSR